MELIELPHLSVGSPSEITPACISQVEMCDLLESTRRVKARSEFVGERLVVDETVCACRRDGALVEVHGIERASLDPGNLSADQRGAVLEVLWAVLHPEFELTVVRDQSLDMLLALLCRCGVAGRRLQQRTIEMI